jgi:8-oxo-dGTP pyrophosphatase MutT (NUDIX family)
MGESRLDVGPIPVVRLILPDAERRVLILRRAAGTEGGGQWCLPGGKVDYGDTVEETVAKELREETSLVCDAARFLFYQDSPPMRPGGMHCINFYFECQTSGRLVLNDESSEWARIGPEDFASYEIAFCNDQGLMRYWQLEV